MTDLLPAPFDLTDRVALVTGGGTGIGEATAHVLAQFGAECVLASRKLENLERVAKDVANESGRRCLAVRADVREEDDVEAMIERTITEFGRIDILVNNAGGSYLFPLVETPPDRWDNSVNLNLRGPFLCTRAAGRHMLERRSGVIVNISSGAGVHGVRGGAAYSAAKAGLQMFTRVVAAEWGPKGIRANAIAVGLVASGNALRSWERSGIDPESMRRGIALRRVGTPMDIAYPVLFLASDASSYLSGETIYVNGGPTMGGLPDED